MKKTAFFLMLLTILSKIFGFFREVTLSFFYGASNISDAYLISTTIPRVIFGFVTAGIVAGFIPMYGNIFHKEGLKKAQMFTNNITNILLVLCTIIIFTSFSFTETIVSMFASGFDNETMKITVKFTRITLFALYFTMLVSIFTGYLQSNKNFVIPGLIGLPLNIIIIFSVIISSKTNIVFLPIGFLIAVVSQFLFMIYSIRKTGFKYRNNINFKDGNLKKMFLIALPIILGISVNQINILIDRTLASQIKTGGISALNYASTLNEFVQGIFVLSIITVLYPLISALAAKNKMNELKSHLSSAINGIFITVLPVSICTMLFSKEIVALLFGRGAFDLEAITMTSNALFYYSIGMIGFGIREVLSRVFYSMQDTKTPMINAIIGIVVNIVLNIYLSKIMGIGGLALATSIAGITTSLLMILSLKRKIGSFGIKRISISFVKIIFASSLMSIFSNKIFIFLTTFLNQNLSLLISILFGFFIYCIILYFMKIKDIENILLTVKKKFANNDSFIK